jgi:hypothetical protein
MQHLESTGWTTNSWFEARALNYTDRWEEGVIPVALTYLNSHENFNGILGIRIPGSPGALNSSATATIATQFESAGNGVRILQTGTGTNPNTNYFSNLNLPPNWKSSLPMETLSEMFSTVIKFIVNIIQMFLMFVRPFSPKWRNRWTLWFASSMQQLQLWLGLGGITGNFGGVIDNIQVGQLNAMQRNFFIDNEIEFDDQYTTRSRGALLEKFEMARWTYSII